MYLNVLIEVCLNCLGYAYEQLTTSEIDILGASETHPNNWQSYSEDMILSAYAQLYGLIPDVPYRDIPTSVLLKHFGG